MKLDAFKTVDWSVVVYQRQKLFYAFNRPFILFVFGRDNAESLGETTQKTTQKTNLREKILKILKASPTLTIQEVANICGITYDGAKYHFTALRKAGIIRHDGGYKGGSWKILK